VAHTLPPMDTIQNINTQIIMQLLYNNRNMFGLTNQEMLDFISELSNGFTLALEKMVSLSENFFNDALCFLT
jgi:hypothetical protein